MSWSEKLFIEVGVSMSSRESIEKLISNAQHTDKLCSHKGLHAMSGWLGIGSKYCAMSRCAIFLDVSRRISIKGEYLRLSMSTCTFSDCS